MADPSGNRGTGDANGADGAVDTDGEAEDPPPEPGFGSGLFEVLPDPAIVVDPGTGQVLAVNGATEELLGRDRDRMVGTDFAALHPASETRRYRTLIERTVKAGDLTAARIDGEGGFHLVDADGAAVPVEVSARGVEVEGRTCVLGTFRDVSGRDRRERVLEELHGANRRLLRADSPQAVAAAISEVTDEVLELPLHAVMLYDDEADVLEKVAVSEQAAGTYEDTRGVERGEGIVWEAFESGEPLVYGDVREVPSVYNPETEVRSEFVVPIGEFGVFVVSSTTVDDFDAADVALGKVLAANAEVALDRLERERRLHEQTQKLRTIVDNAPVVLFALDAEGTFTLSEGKGLENLGLEPGEAVGDSIFDRYADQEGVLEDARRALDGDPVNSAREVEDRAYETWYQPVERDGDVVQVIGVAVEVTERERRERLVRVLNRFLRHNLRNAMTVMVGYAERLEGHDDPLVREAVERITETGEDLTRLSEKARRLGQMVDADDEAEVVDVRRSLDRILDRLELAHDATFECDYDDAPTPVDESVELALREVCENAVKHADSEPTVEVSVRRRDDRVVVDVVDRGPGLPPQERAVLNSTAETPLRHGSGLGLLVAHWAVTDVGGEIRVPETDDGTTVRVVVPAADDRDGNGNGDADTDR